MTPFLWLSIETINTCKGHVNDDMNYNNNKIVAFFCHVFLNFKSPCHSSFIIRFPDDVDLRLIMKNQLTPIIERFQPLANIDRIIDCLIEMYRTVCACCEIELFGICMGLPYIRECHPFFSSDEY